MLKVSLSMHCYKPQMMKNDTGCSNLPKQVYEPAIISMAKVYFESDDNSQAIMWLKKAAEFDASSAFKLANLYWKQGEFASAETYFGQSSSTRLCIGFKLRYKLLNNIKMEPLQSLLAVPVQGPNCAQTIQFVATNAGFLYSS